MAICLGHLPWSKHSSSFLFIFFSTSWELLFIFLNPPLCLDTRGVFQFEVLISIAWGCSSSGPVREIILLFQVALTYLLHIQSQVALTYLCISFSRSLWPLEAFPFPGLFDLLTAYPIPGRFDLLMHFLFQVALAYLLHAIPFPGRFGLLLTLFNSLFNPLFSPFLTRGHFTFYLGIFQLNSWMHSSEPTRAFLNYLSS